VAQDQQFETSLERLVATLREDMAAALQRRETEVTQKNTAEREAAVRQAAEAARQEIEEQLARVRQETQDQLARLRQAAHEQTEAAKRAAQAEAAARARAEAEVEDVRRIGRSQVEEVQQTLGDRISALMRELDDTRREVAARRQEVDSARGASAVSLTDLVRGVHAVDEAESLGSVLERLIEAAHRHSKAASLLLVRDEGLKQWTGTGSESRLRINERGMTVASNSASERRRVESETAIAFPVSVGGDVVAVLYAEVDDALSPQRRISKDALDTLTRHASRVLETITVQQAAGLRPLRRDQTLGRSGYAAGDQLP
jgi:hypothetical protein